MVATKQGMLLCRPVFAHYAELCARYTPERVAEICWIAPDQVEAAARLIWHSRPVSYYAWSGHEHHANTTETARAMALLYALTGSFDQRGGNVLFPAVPNSAITGEDLPAARRMAPAVGVEKRPLGPAKWNNVSAHDFYRAVLESEPYPMRGLVGFGSNLLLAFSDPLRGRRALAALDFYIHADLFMNPTAELADIVLPLASCFERARSHPLCRARSDISHPAAVGLIHLGIRRDGARRCRHAAAAPTVRSSNTLICQGAWST